MASIFLRRPPEQAVGVMPGVGDSAPDVPDSDNYLLIFLRHVGCPFAEQAVREARSWKRQHPQVQVCIVSHGDAASTAEWLTSIGGSEGLETIIDESRGLHGTWGLGFCSGWHFMGPRSLFGVMRLWPQGVFNRSASGTRWQQSGMFRVVNRRVRWRHIPASAQEFQLPES